MTLEFSREHVRALENCSYCPRLCHFACPTAHGEASETASPWGMMSVANMLRKGHLEPDAHAVRDLYRCSSCDRCTAFCRHGNPVAEILRESRAQLMPEGFEPAEVASLAQTGRDAGTPTPIRGDVRALLEERPAASSGIGYFPGCASAERPAERIEHTLSLLSRVAGAEVGLAASSTAFCCGQWAGRAGLRADEKRISDRLAEVISGYDTVVTGCAGLRARSGSTRVVSLHDFLAARADAVAEAVRGQDAAPKVTLHGGCNPRTPTTDTAAERAVLEAAGFEVEAEHALADQSECCSGDVLYSHISPDGARAAADAVVRGVRTVESRLVTVSDRCAAHMSKSSGEAVRSVLDLLLERCTTPR